MNQKKGVFEPRRRHAFLGGREGGGAGAGRAVDHAHRMDGRTSAEAPWALKRALLRVGSPRGRRLPGGPIYGNCVIRGDSRGGEAGGDPLCPGGPEGWLPQASVADGGRGCRVREPVERVPDPERRRPAVPVEAQPGRRRAGRGQCGPTSAGTRTSCTCVWKAPGTSS
jgi:hypothetical protein